jgi:flavin-dependent dehydrogenase
VALIHATGDRGRKPPLGEVLPPAARPTLGRLGLGDLLDDAGHLPSPGTVSAWGSGTPVETDFLLSPYGDGVRLDRDRLDRDLGALAEARGTRLVAGWWARSGGGPIALLAATARVLVDCTGRSATVARAFGARVVRLDRLVAVAGVLRPERADLDADARTFVAATPDGWWYAALLPDGRRVAAFLTDADLLEPRLRQDPRAWHAALLGVPLIGPLVRRSAAPAPPGLHVLAADSRRLVPPDPDAGEASPGGSSPLGPSGRLVIAAGDAAMAFDPLSSRGILSAIESAEAAAGQVVAVLSGDRAAIEAANRDRAASDRARWSRYLARLAEAYGDERRWPEAPFWARRHGAVDDRRPDDAGAG